MSYKSSHFDSAVLVISALLMICGTKSRAETQVTDETGAPMAGVLVQQLRPSVINVPPEPEQFTTISVTTENGVFDAPPSIEPALLVISRKGQVTLAMDATQPLPAHVVLPRHAEIGGTVLRQDGSRVTDAQIGPVRPLLEEDEWGNVIGGEPIVPPFFARTNQSGFFRVGGLLPGEYTFHVHAPGLAPQIAMATTGVVTSVTLSSKGTTWTGTLRGSRDLQPKRDVIVEAGSGMLRVYSRTDKDGKFEFSILDGDDWRFRTTSSPVVPAKTARIRQKTKSPDGIHLELLENEGVTLSGHFLDATTSKGIAGMRVDLATMFGTDVRTTATRSDGSFRFENVDAFTQWSLGFDSSAYTYHSPRQRRWLERIPISTAEGTDITTLALHLTPRIRVHGKVVSPGQKLIPGAEILLRSVEPVYDQVDETPVYKVYTGKSDALGRFSVGVFPAGRYQAIATAGTVASRPTEVDAYSTATAEVLLEAQPIATLRGVALSHESKPLSNAWVEVSSAPQSEVNGDEANDASLLDGALTDGSGTFALTAPFTGEVELTASHPSYLEPITTRTILTTQTTAPVVLKFPAANELSVKVVDQDNVAVEGVSLQITADLASQEAGTSSSRARRLTTGADGRSRFLVQAKKISALRATHPAYEPFTVEDLALPQTDYVVRLTKFPMVVVTLTAPGVPEDQLRSSVWLLRAPGEKDSEKAPHPSHFSSFRHSQAMFGKAPFENVPPGWYKAAASTDNEFIYSESDPFRVEAGASTVDIELPLTSGASLSGTITDAATGKPLKGAEVVVQLQSGTSMDFEAISTPTDSSGRYRIATLPAGELALTARHPSYSAKAQLVTIPTSGEAKADISLSHEETFISGRVTLDGRPLANATVVVYKNADEGEWLGSAVSGPDGRYSIKGVPEGVRTLVAEGLWGEDAKALRRTHTIFVSGQEANVDVAFNSLVRVTGRIHLDRETVDPQQTQRLYFRSHSSPGEMKHTVLSPDGRYEIDLEPGQYLVGLHDAPSTPVLIPSGRDEMLFDFNVQELLQRPAP